ncbi:MAG: aldo/keto reductase [Brumimicrobium sp.]|nr:aldo/keto reductase [Brumimicrobium sp.]
MKTLKFKNGDEMPALGLGTWKSRPGEVKEAILTAIKTGYRHIDCAPIYGNEEEIGLALQHAFDAGLVKREEMWITSKLWNDSHREEHVLPALKKTLKDLKLDYLDLYLVHWPVAFEHGVTDPSGSSDFLSLEEVPLSETWRGMQKTIDEDLVRHIGVSNFKEEKIQELLEESDFIPEMNQVEMHPMLPQEDLVEFCKDRDIHLTAYSPLGSADRSEQMKQDNEPALLENETIKAIAEKHDATTAQILISWQLHRGVATIPKSTNSKRIKENFASASLKLEQADMDKINQIDYEFRFIDGSFWEEGGEEYSQKALWG